MKILGQCHMVFAEGVGADSRKDDGLCRAHGDYSDESERKNPGCQAGFQGTHVSPRSRLGEAPLKTKVCCSAWYQHGDIGCWMQGGPAAL